MHADEFAYPVVLTPDPEGRGIRATVPDLPEAIAEGNTETEALMAAVEAIESALLSYVEYRMKLPTASPPRPGQHTVGPSATECAKLRIYQDMIARGMTYPNWPRIWGKDGCR